MAEPNMQIKLDPGCEAVIAEFSVGPQRGKSVISTSAKPGDIDEIIGVLRAMPRSERRGKERSITTAIRRVVTSSAISNLRPGNDQDFLADLRLLAALKEVLGDKVLADAGVSRLLRVTNEELAEAGVGEMLSRTIH